MRNIFTRNLLLLVSILSTTGIAIGQTYNVTTGANDGPGSLRNAVNQANADAFTPSFITFDSAITVLLTSGQIQVTDELKITGNIDGSTIINGVNSSERAFSFTNVSGTLGKLSFKNFTSAADGGSIIVENADSFNVSNCIFLNNKAEGAKGGGALYLDNVATSKVMDSEFTLNNATATAGSGGAIFLKSSGTLTVTQSTFTTNTAIRAGGAVESDSPNLISFINTNFINNKAFGGTSPGNGGGFHITGSGNSLFNGGTAIGNTAIEGGAFWNGSGTMTINGVAFSSNSALGPNTGGGALFNNGGTLHVDATTNISQNIAVGAIPGGRGGAIFNNTGGSLMLASGLNISGNYASRAGGAIEDASGGNLMLVGITLEGNSAGADIGLGIMANPGNGGALHLSGTTSATISNSIIKNNQAALEGGGLWNNAGMMTVTGSTITGNIASGNAADDGGGGIFNNGGALMVSSTTISNNLANGTAGSGGGIFSLTPGTLNINGITITGNTANRAGGGIEILSAPGEFYNFSNVTMSGNLATGATAPGNGGAFHISGNGNSTFNNCIVQNNTAVEGGGLWNGPGTMTVSGTEINGNKATGNATGGGGIFNNGGILNVDSVTILTANIAMGAIPGGRGGALFNNIGGTLNVSTGITISGNYASRAGGAIEDASNNTLSLDGVTLNGNSAGVDIGMGSMANPGNGGAVHLSGTTNATIINSTIQDNKAAQEGGGLWNNAGIMTVGATLLTGNIASGILPDDGGGALFNNGGTLNVLVGTEIINNKADGAAGSGGGIHSTGGSVIVTDAIITTNIANRAGGGIEIAGGTLTLSGTTLNTNNVGVAPAVAAPGNGGGLHVGGTGNATIIGGTVNGNMAASEGGGLWNGNGIMIVDGVPITNNIASGAAADNGGGGLFNDGGTLTILAGTSIKNNMANGTSGSGGGILSVAGAVSIANIQITENYANRAGGAIEVINGELNLNGTTLDLNNVNGTAGTPNPGNGGGMHVTGVATINIYGSTINNNNAASEGGGLWNQVGSTMTVDSSLIENNTALGNDPTNGGGGIFNNGGILRVQNSSTITNNAASGTGGSGGGIQNVDGGSLSVINSTVSNNSAKRAGGGIEDNSSATPGIVTLLNTNLDNNNAGDTPGNGGGLHITGPGTATVTNGTVNGNIAKAEGGGLWNGSGTMTVDNVNIDGNIASGNDPDQGGGGIFNEMGTLIIMNTTILNNIANGTSGSGGGILNNLGVLTVSDSNLTGNKSMRAGGGIEENSVAGSELNLTNVIFTSNTTSAAPGNGGGLHITGAGNSNIIGGSATGNIAASEGGALWNGAGIMTVNGMIINGNNAEGAAADNGGGGVFNNGGTLNIVNGTSITNNLSTGALGSGGGLFSTAGDVTITNSSLSGNSANRAGGAIELIDGTLTFTNSDMIDNDVNGTAGTASPGNGGGLHVTGNSGLIIISASSVSGNKAAREGGGLWNQSGTVMSIDTSIIDGNTSFGPATDDGGAGIFNNGGMLEIITSTISNNNATAGTSSGGAIHNATGGDVVVKRSTLSGNSANGAGGGVYNNGASLDLNAVTIAMNIAGSTGGGIEGATTTSLKNTLVALNTATSGMDINGNFVSNNYNLIGNDDAGAFMEQANDIENVDPMLGPLQNNGGLTDSHEILLGSMAYNAGDPADLFNDQNEQLIFEGIRDIGAFEAQTILLSIEDITDGGSGISIYPNPSKGFATARIPVSFGNDVQITIVEIGSGKIVRNTRITNGERDLDFNSYSNGVYLIKFISETSSSTHRLILSK